jgi:hypothetical protein
MLTEDEGVKAIQYLLNIFGLEEPEETSRINWNIMTDEQKIKTEESYNAMKSNEN